MENSTALFTIIFLCLIFLVRWSVLFNIATLAIVGGVIFMTYVVYTQREDRETTAADVGKDLITDPLVVGRAYFSGTKTGPIGDFSGRSSWPDDNGLKALPEEVS